MTANGPNSNEIAVDLSVSMQFAGHLNGEQVQDAVSGSVDVVAVAADEQPDLHEFEIGAELDVICDSAVIDPNGLDSADSDDLNAVEADFGHLANADLVQPN